MDTLYWMVEYGKVFGGYLFLMFLWPSVVFYRHLKKKTIAYRFGFCVSVSVITINMVVLLLGLFHILDEFVVRLLFYGMFVGAFLKEILRYMDLEYKKAELTKLPNVHSLRGRYNIVVLACANGIFYLSYIKKAGAYLVYKYVKAMKSDGLRTALIRNGRKAIGGILAVLKNHGLLIGVLIYGMSYFSYGAFQIHSYGYGDLYVHHEWIHGLMKGNIFAGGVYPEAMHCFIYCMHILLGIRIYSILLFLQGIHVVIFLISAYLLLRDIFYWRYTPVFVLMLFLTLDLCNADQIHSMFRLQITMPMEFGIHAVCLCPLYLMQYLREPSGNWGRTGHSKYCWNSNLFLFLITLTAAAATHFHVLLMTILMCGAFAVFKLKRLLCRKYLIPVVVAGMGACLIAGLPMAGAVSQGNTFNGSIDWAISAMDGYESKELRGQQEQFTSPGSILPGIYQEGYKALYGEKRGRLFFLLTLAVVGVCLYSSQNTRLQFIRKLCTYYPPVILSSVLYIIVYAAPMIGIPDMIPEGRFFAPGHMMMLAVAMMGIDILFAGLMCYCNAIVLQILSYVSIVGIYGGAITAGCFRGYLFYELTRYNAAVMVTNSIIDTYPRYSYTIVSPTDELYQMNEYGWHEELLSFVEKSVEEEYTIPSEYIFIYVEKKPIYYAQSYFFTGSSWIGEEKYLRPYWNVYSLKYPDNTASQSPEIKSSEISPEKSAYSLPEYDNPWEMYLYLDYRTLLESKTYDWCKRFAKRYSSALDVYYEDEEFVCYYLRQDANSGLYNLSIQ